MAFGRLLGMTRYDYNPLKNEVDFVLEKVLVSNTYLKILGLGLNSHTCGLPKSTQSHLKWTQDITLRVNKFWKFSRASFNIYM